MAHNKTGRVNVSMLALLLSIVTVSAAAAKPDPGMPTARASSVGMSADRLDRIGPAMQKYIDDGLVPGTVTIVARRGKVVHFEARGFMDAESDKPMRTDAIFRIASMTKPITTVALMMLWEEGKFQLNDPVSKFIPSFADQVVSTSADSSGTTGELVDVKSDATIRHMMTHTAGLANSYIGNVEYYRAQTRRQADDTLEKYIDRLAALPLNYQPGEAWQYSTATSVVGRLVEVISGQTLAEFMEDRIFQPLGMPDTHFYLDDDQDGRLTSQYTPGEEDNKIVLQDPGSNESRWVTAENKSVFSGSGGLLSTPHDYLRFQSAMLNGGELDGARLLSPSTLSLMMDNHTGDLPIWLAGPGMGFGLGWGYVVDRGKAGTPLSEGSVYWGGAYCTISWIDPEQELIGILMTQVRPYRHINIRQDFQVLTH